MLEDARIRQLTGIERERGAHLERDRFPGQERDEHVVHAGVGVQLVDEQCEVVHERVRRNRHGRDDPVVAGCGRRDDVETRRGRQA